MIYLRFFQENAEKGRLRQKISTPTPKYRQKKFRRILQKSTRR
jgi:hypothetical protein